MSYNVLLAEISVTPAGGSETILRVSDGPVRPWPPTDPDRPNAITAEILVETSEIGVDLYADLTRLASGYGSASLALSATAGGLAIYDGAHWGAVAIYLGEVAQDGAPRPFAEWTPLLRGRVDTARLDLDISGPSRLRLAVFDPRGDLDSDVQDRTYAGTNTGATGYEGAAEDIAGRPVPLALGDLLRANISPPCVNTARQVYQLNDGGEFGAEVLRAGGGDSGATMAGDLTPAAFDAASPTPGSYVRDRERGLIALGGGIITGQLTVCLQGAQGGSYVHTAPALITRLLTRAGVDAGAIGDSFGTIDAPAPVGLWLDQPTSYRAAIETLARSIGAWCVPDDLGVWQIGRLEAPSGAPAEVLDGLSIRDLIEDDPTDSIPAWRITVRYARNYTVMRRADLAGAVQETDRAAELAREWREAGWSDPATKAAYGAAARDLIVESALVEAADAHALAASLGTLFGVRRRSWRVVVELTAARRAWQVGTTCIELDYPALGISGLYRVIGRRLLSPASHLITFRLWG
ncbi:MAG: hypothetical protein PHS60_11805 [Zavarzinia sp.]|nr:hypothetical protein [Zavarzinia sp.]